MLRTGPFGRRDGLPLGAETISVYVMDFLHRARPTPKASWPVRFAEVLPSLHGDLAICGSGQGEDHFAGLHRVVHCGPRADGRGESSVPFTQVSDLFGGLERHGCVTFQAFFGEWADSVELFGNPREIAFDRDDFGRVRLVPTVSSGEGRRRGVCSVRPEYRD